VPLRDLLNDEQRNEKLRCTFGSSVHFDYSHTHIDSEGIDLLNKVAAETQVGSKIESMFKGEAINATEGRKVWHVKLREGLNGEQDETTKMVNEVRQKIRAFTTKVRSGDFKGYTGKPLRNFVCIGIGGSYLGPEFVYEALRYE